MLEGTSTSTSSLPLSDMLAVRDISGESVEAVAMKSVVQPKCVEVGCGMKIRSWQCERQDFISGDTGLYFLQKHGSPLSTFTAWFEERSVEIQYLHIY